MAEPGDRNTDTAPWEREEILELAERSAGIGVWDVDMSTGLLRGRPQLFQLLGLSPTAGSVPMDDLRAMRHPDDRDRVADGLQHVLDSGSDFYEVEFRIIRPDGEVRWIFRRGRIVRDRRGKPIRYSGVDMDITERKAAEAALTESERRYRTLVDNASDIVVTTDLDMRVTSINPAVERVLGYAPEEVIGTLLSQYVPAEELAKHQEMLARKFEGIETTRYETDLRRKDGHRSAVEVNSKLVLDALGQPVGVHSIARDITERRNAEARQMLLLRELQHRTKNILAVVQSIVLNTLTHGHDLASAREAIVGRLQAIARAQEFVASGKSGGAPLRELIEGQLATFTGRARVEGPPIFAGAPFAQMFALVIHELATNASKYGSLSQPGGRIDIAWAIKPGATEPLLAFSWMERDGPPVAPPKNKGFGSRLILAALSGTPTVSFGQQGFEYTIDVPLADVVRTSRPLPGAEETAR
ncbi:MAG TPA: PAS domain S-box protein [Hyphomicrobiaceae bacterium]|nr:PAS domain S-box protein [Hyphomicrobiaceae bacterium]